MLTMDDLILWWFHSLDNIFSLNFLQALVFNSKESAGVSEEIQGNFFFNNMLGKLHNMSKTNTNDGACRSGPAHSGGGGPATVHGQDQRWERAALLLRSGFSIKVSLCVCVCVRVLLLKQVSIDSEGIKRCSGLICMCCLVFECFVSLAASVGIALKLREKWWKGAAHFAPAL